MLVYSLMRRIRIFYGSIKLIQFILIFILIILLILYEIKQQISSTDSWMECMSFHVQLLNCYIMFWDGGPCGMGGNIGLSSG